LPFPTYVIPSVSYTKILFHRAEDHLYNNDGRRVNPPDGGSLSATWMEKVINHWK
jgi:hypothetical protein